jgi:protein required for attachment to host cells
MAQKHWILTANSSVARLFERSGMTAPLTELADWMHAEGSMRTSELERAPLGHSLGGRAGLAPRTDPQRRERSAFAHELADWLHEAVLAHRITDITVLASNPFLGELLSQLDPGVQKMVRAHHPLDLTALTVQALDHKVRADFSL